MLLRRMLTAPVWIGFVLGICLVAFLAACGGGEGGDNGESADTADTSSDQERAEVGPIDLAVYDPDNVIGDAEDCVVEVLDGIEGDPRVSVDYGVMVFQAASECGVEAELRFNNMSGLTILGEP